MQILTAGSFLNLENDSGVEALKFTARRLAEHSASVVAENLNIASLENLANSLWEKAEYLTRETERRRLQEVFTQNFSERFRELKPEVSGAKNSSFETESKVSTINTIGSVNPLPTPEKTESGESENANCAKLLPSAVSKEDKTVAQEKSDEFLGFVENDKSLEETTITESEAKMTTTSEASALTNAQTAHEPVSEKLKPENLSSVDEKSNTENQTGDKSDSEAEKPNDAKPQTDTTSAKSENITTSVSKNNAPATNAKESFDFEKCTINLNLTLLPTESGGIKRKAIISAASHDLPPEIDFLEIAEGEDLTSIANLVQEKLKRFQQTLPVKYIEQLRASKTKSARKPSTAKANTAPTKTENDKPSKEKESGEPKGQDEKSVEPEKTQALANAEENKTSVSSDFMPTVNQTNAAHEIQQSLF
ncbi:MAG: hypothetical protein H0W58_16365 [Acidobacteria bacterium]|jgi:hypothetical protein|nr:hypothetical protein [Acidobacteriota bacterium]